MQNKFSESSCSWNPSQAWAQWHFLLLRPQVHCVEVKEQQRSVRVTIGGKLGRRRTVRGRQVYIPEINILMYRLYGIVYEIYGTYR